ncbi:MAG: OmpA family protein, partial [Bacteroidota bacterium]
DDLLDGHRWEETLTLTANSDYLQTTTIGINFRLGKGEESYWWQNPLTTIYNDVRDIKRFNSKGHTDSDKDGVPNSRDKEADTPEGVMVDAQGRAIDSDGDGLQDFRDKEPFSPKGAEVDASGVAKDSDNDGVIDFFDVEPNSAAGAQADANGKTIEAPKSTGEPISQLPMIHFDLGKSKVKDEYYPDILRVARMLNDNSDMRVRIIGHADVRGKSKKNFELSEARAKAVSKVLSDVFGIASNRLELGFKGSDDLLVKGLPGIYNADNEPLHFLNRRVEFQIIK